MLLKDCPSQTELSRFLLGKLSQPQHVQLASHIEDCEHCQHAVDTIHLTNDTLISRLQHASGPDRHEAEKECKQAVEAVVALGRESSHSNNDVNECDSDESPDSDIVDTLAPDAGDSQYELDPSTTFGRYRILSTLGRGGMGAVYLAKDPELDRKIAIKIPNVLGPAREALLDRFRRETRSIAQLNHPNICPVYDVSEFDGTPYMAMAFIEGQPLNKFIRPKKRLPLRQVVKLTRIMALALQHAHDLGVIHRDLKPANIIINQNKQPVIMDFGLARREGSTDTQLTQQGQIMGTPDYMSPEQVSGDVEQMGPSCDIYSLGVIMYEMLTCKRPFKGDLLALLTAIATKQPTPPSAHRPEVDESLDAICLTAIAKKVDDRYATMSDFADALQKYLQATVSAEPEPSEPSDRSIAPDTQRDLAGRTQTDAADSAVAAEFTGAASSDKKTNADASRNDRQEVAKKQIDAAVEAELAAKALPPSRTISAPIAAATLAVLSLAAMATIMLLPTKHGIVRVEINDPAIEVTVGGNDQLRVKGAKGANGAKGEFRIQPGSHTLQITAGETVFKTKEFTIGKGELVDLRVTMLDKDTVRILKGEVVLEEHDLKQGTTANLATDGNRVGGAPDGTAPVGDAFAWKPSTHQQAFIDAVAQLPKSQRPKTIQSKLSEISFDGVEAEFNESLTSVKIASRGFHQIWPLAALPTLKSVDLAKSSVTDIRPLLATGVEDLNVDFAVYNPNADAMIKSISSLKNINGLTKAAYLAERAAIRQEIDDFAKTAGAISTTDIIKWINPLLSKLNPGSPVKLAAVGASSHNLIGYTRQAGGMELNARLCGGLRDLSPLRVIPFDILSASGGDIFDLAPLAGLPIRKLSLNQQPVADLGPLQGMPLESLSLQLCMTRDLSPLRGMKLKSLSIHGCPIADLDALRNMPLTNLQIPQTPIVDLSPLQGMKLQTFNCSSTPVSDISALKGMPLTSLQVTQGKVGDAYRWFRWGPPLQEISNLDVIRGMPLESISLDYKPEFESLLDELPLKSINGFSVDEFKVRLRKERDAVKIVPLAGSLKTVGDPRSQSPHQREEFLTLVAKLPLQARINAVAARLVELGAQQVELTPHGESPTHCILDSWSLHQIWPLAALPSIESLDIGGASVTNFAPLSSLPLKTLRTELVLFNTKAEEAIRSHPTLVTVNGQARDEFLSSREALRDEIKQFRKTAEALNAVDIFPWIQPRLKALNPKYSDPALTTQGIQPGDPRISLSNGKLMIWRGNGLVDLSPLRVLKFTELHISAGSDGTYDLTPLQGLPLTSVRLSGARLADIAPLEGLPLELLELSGTQVTDLSPLATGAKTSLKDLNLRASKVRDLTPLENMSIEALDVSGTPLTSLASLRGLPLIRLSLNDTSVRDLSPLAKLPLKHLFVGSQYSAALNIDSLTELPLETISLKYHSHYEDALKSMPLKTINGMSAKAFWESLKSQRAKEAADVLQSQALPLQERVAWAQVRGRFGGGDVRPSFEIAEETAVAATIQGRGNHRIADLQALRSFPDLRHITLTGIDARSDITALAHIKSLEKLTLDEGLVSELSHQLDWIQSKLGDKLKITP